MAINKVIYKGNTLIDVTDCDVTEADVAAGKKFIKKNGEKAVGTSTGGGGTSAVLGELNASSNGTYEAGGAMTLIPGGIYQFKEQLPVETLVELYTAAQGNNGVIFSVAYQGMDVVKLAIYKTGDIYILESSSLAGMAENIYSTGTTTFTYTSLNSGSDVTVDLASGWNTYLRDEKCEPPAQSTIRLPQDISGIPNNIINLVDLQFDTNNCVEAVLDASTNITVENFGTFFKVTSSLNPSKRLAIVSLSGYDEFNIPEGDMGLELAGMTAVFRNSAASSELQTDIEGIKYFKSYMSNVALMYVEDASKIKVTSGTAENGCWYLNQYMVMDPNWSWVFAYDKDLVDGYNKVTVNVHSQPKLQSKTATINGVYSPDEGFDGLSQVTVNFALQDKTVTANGTYTCDEGYGGLGQVEVNIDNANLQDKTITENGTYTADSGYVGLGQVTVAVKVESRTFFNDRKLAIHTMEGEDNLNKDTNFAAVERLIINEGITSIYNSSTASYANLSDVILPSTLQTIGNRAFYKCKKLVSISIPDQVTSIGYGAFNSCNALTGITLPEGITQIGDVAFQSCTKLASINLPNSITSIGYRAFQSCWALKEITLPSSLTEIADGAFGGCEALVTISLPETLTSIGESAFSGCAFTDLSLPSGITLIGESAFYGCTNWRSDVVIPSGVTRIEPSTFYSCRSLTSITIPASVTFIGWRAMFDVGRGTNSKTTFRLLGETPPTIDRESFTAKYINQIIVPAGCGEAYKTAKGWSAYADYITEMEG